MGIEHHLEGRGEQGGSIPCFDFSHVVCGFHIIACEDQFSSDFSSCVAKICDAWEGVKLKVIRYSEISRRLVARIWLPKIRIDKDKLIQSLRLQNFRIPINNWVFIKREEP